MQSFTLYAIPLFLAAFISYSVAIYSWKLRQFKGILPFSLVIILGGTWALAAGFDTLTADPSLKIFWLQVKITTAALLPVCWLTMVFTLVGKRYLLRGYWLALLLIVPVITLGLTWSIGQHDFLRFDFSVDSSGAFPVLMLKNGPWWFVHVIYGYLVQVASIAFLVNILRDSRTLYGRQAISMLCCVFLPAIPDFLFTLDVSPVHGFNFTPATFAVVSLLLGWALFRYQLFDLAPIARGTLIEMVQDLMLVFDTHNRLVDFNPAARNNSDLKLALLLGSPMSQVFKAYPDLLKKSLDNGFEKAEIQVSGSGKPQAYDLVVTPLKNNHCIALGRLFLLRNVTTQKTAAEELHLANEQLQAKLLEIEQLQTKLREDAIRDRLTGLYNRRYLDETLQREVAGVERGGGYLSVVMLDIDHFKNINDSFGHKTGDMMLQSLGRLLQEQTRCSDIACRYGGEEFVLVMPGISVENAYQRVEQLRVAFENIKVTCGDNILQATFSAGIAVYPEHAVTGEELLYLADHALYQAKTGGRNNVRVYENPAPFQFKPYDDAEKLLGQREYEFFGFNHN